MREVLKDKLVFVYLTAVGDAVSFLQVVIKELKGLLTIAKHMEVGNAVYSQGVVKEQKGVLLCVRRTVVGSVVSLKEVGFARRVCMVGLTSALLMVVGRDVLWKGVLRVLVVALIVVLSTVVGNGVGLVSVGRVLKGVVSCAKLMVVGRGVVGEVGSVRSLLEGRVVCVLSIIVLRRKEKMVEARVV